MGLTVGLKQENSLELKLVLMGNLLLLRQISLDYLSSCFRLHLTCADKTVFSTKLIINYYRKSHDLKYNS